MRHENVWLDRTIHRTSIKTERVVREAAAAVMTEKYRINLTFFLLFASLSLLLLLQFYYSHRLPTIIDQINQSAYQRDIAVQCNNSSSSNNKAY